MTRVTLYLILLAATLLVFPPKVRAEYVDLEGADIVGEPQPCRFDGRVRGCVLVKKNSQHYQVVFDQKGEYKIFKVELETRNNHVFVVRPVLLWVRGAI